MYLFYTYEQLQQFICFSWIDFTTFTVFEQSIFTIGVNIYFLVFLIFILSIAYKLFNRIWNYLF